MRARIVTPFVLSFVVVANTFGSASAQTPAAAATTPLPPEKPAMTQQEKEKTLSAKQLFGGAPLPSIGKAVAIGYYPRGCLAGAVEFPANGPNWQVMRLSRNRYWGHPSLINFLEKFAPAAAKATGWKGILVGDLSQPRGGPSPSDHASHQIGLDVDIWFMPMPDHELSKEERDKIAAINLVSDDWKHLNTKTWTPQHVAFIKTAAQQPGVRARPRKRRHQEGIVPCRRQGARRRLDGEGAALVWPPRPHPCAPALPGDSPNCRAQPPVPGDDGCSAKELNHWFSDKVLHPQIAKPAPPAKPPKPVMLSDLPPACKTVLELPDKNTSLANDKH